MINTCIHNNHRSLGIDWLLYMNWIHEQPPPPAPHKNIPLWEAGMWNIQTLYTLQNLYITLYTLQNFNAFEMRFLNSHWTIYHTGGCVCWQAKLLHRSQGIGYSWNVLIRGIRSRGIAPPIFYKVCWNSFRPLQNNWILKKSWQNISKSKFSKYSHLVSTMLVCHGSPP